MRAFRFVALFVSVFTFVPAYFCQAQFFGGNVGNRVVGGIKIDADGVVADVSVPERTGSLKALRAAIVGGQGALAKPQGMRMVSLKSIQHAMKEAAQSGSALPEEIALLGGLTRIEYVFAYPEKNDIVLAGPSENWTVGPQGTIVGMESGRPIVCLEDLVASFRAMAPNTDRTISCSIDPTPEGTKKLSQLLGSVQLGPNSDPRKLEPAMRNAFGPQLVTLTGVATTSHVAHVLLAADYQMKRLGMNLAEPPVKLPSYVEMIRNRNVQSPQSRWWMACDYNAIEKSEDGLAWKLSGRGIKALSEQEIVLDDGAVKQTGKVEATAQKWADLFTASLEELSIKEPVFGELRNVMDCCVIAALLHRNQLAEVAACDLSVLAGTTPSLKVAELASPKKLPPQCSFLKTSAGWVVTASGGVLIDGWKVTEKTTIQPELSAVQSRAKPQGDQWFW